MENESMPFLEMLKQIATYFFDNVEELEVVNSDGMLSISDQFSSEYGLVELFIQMIYINEQVGSTECRIYLVPGISVPENKRVYVAELLHRLNSYYGQIPWCMDFDKNRIYMKSSIHLKQGDEIPNHQIEVIAALLIQLYETYYGLILKVAYGDKLPIHVLDEYELGLGSNLN